MVAPAVLVFLVFAAGIVVLIAWGLRAARRKREHRMRIWSGVAHSRGGRYAPASGFWNRRNERIEVHVGEVPIVLDWYSDGGDNPTHYTRVRATVRGISGCVFRVYRERLWSSLGKALGTQDIVIGGHQAFDDFFMVKADHPVLARRLWEPPLMETMLRGFPEATLSCDGSVLELEEVGIWEEPARMNAALDFVAALAARDVYNAGELANVLGARFSWTSAGAPRVELDAPSRVVIEPVVDRERMQMKAQLGEPPATEAMTLSVRNGRPDDAALAAKLPQAAHAHVSRVGDGELSVTEGAASFVWATADVDSESLRAGAELLGSLTGESFGGVYR